MKPPRYAPPTKRLIPRTLWSLLFCLATASAVFAQPSAAATAASLERAETLAANGQAKDAIAIYERLLEVSQPDYIRRGALGALLRLDPTGAEQRIVNILRGPDPTIKPVAIAAVGDLPSPDASEKFGRELAHLQPEQQVWLIDALVSRGDAGARAAIRTALGAQDDTVRLAAIAAVGNLDDASAVPLLSKTLAHAKDAAERRKIELAFASLKGGLDTDQAIIAELKSSAPEAKRLLISTLARRQSHAAVPALLEEAGNTNTTVVRAAFEALGKLATPDDLPALVNKLVELPQPDVRPDAEGAVAQTILRIADASHRSDAVCAALARTTAVEARCSLVSLRPTCADAKALAALTAARDDANPRLRDAAVRALAEWPDAAAWEVLADIYRQPENPSYRMLALRALARIAEADNAHPNAALIERYRQLFAGAHTDGDRKLILGALAGAAHPDALQLAVPLLANAAVHAEAVLAVKKIAEAIKDQYPQVAREALERLK
ncbi:MAG: HEAT repeat domain-containing protein [Limisphaerales bacterium]